MLLKILNKYSAATMSYNKVRVAVVEDNGMARANLRNHLLDMGFSLIACFSNGRELKANMRSHRIDLLLMDFHLGQNKNGVEVVQELQKQGLITHTTCVMFVTSDRMPLIIGQIVDVHPEALVIKPYTIRNLMKNISSCFNSHRYMMPVYKAMDQNDNDQALEEIDRLLEENAQPRLKGPLIKLRARILTKLDRYSEAAQHYKDILQRSSKVIWAKWGLIQNLHLDGLVDESEDLLNELTRSQLTNGKACEWLARISVSKNQFSKAEEYILQIRDGELSIAATKLKAHIYQAQQRGDEAISLLEKKRESNRSIRERFDEISLDLARCYIAEAETKPLLERANDLHTAKILISGAGRKPADASLSMRKDYMYAMAAYLEGDPQKCKELLSKPGMDELEHADISTITDAVNVWRNIGDKDKAKKLLRLSTEKLKGIEESNEKTVAGMLITASEDAIGEKKPQALDLNKTGLQHYTAKDYQKATEQFYQAYQLFPRELAFSLNLLQGMVDAQIIDFKGIRTLDFLAELQNRKMTLVNKRRCQELAKRIEHNKEFYGVKKEGQKETQQQISNAPNRLAGTK
jgi:DNA-binding NarL/FixJ family response regulator/TolA-binding protein